MYKALILPICLYSLTVSAADDCQLAIQKIAANTLVFSYTPQQAKIDEPYFYVKAVAENQIPEKKLDTIMSMGENLLTVQNTKPRFYKVPENTKVLYIFKAKSKLDGVNASARIIPMLNDTKTHDKNSTRNATNYLQSLPGATTQLQNKTIGSKGLPAENKIEQVCELAL